MSKFFWFKVKATFHFQLLMWQKIRSFLRLEQENLQICPEVWWFFLVSFGSHSETKQNKSRCWTLKAQQLQLKESHLLLVWVNRHVPLILTAASVDDLEEPAERWQTWGHKQEESWLHQMSTYTVYMKVFKDGSVTHCVCPRQKDWMLYGHLRWLTLIFSSRSAVMMNLSSADKVWTTGGHADHSDSCSETMVH